MTNRILILTDNDFDGYTLKEVLESPKDGSFVVEFASNMTATLERLEMGGIDVILVDLSLPDNGHIAAFDQLFAAAPHTAIMALSTMEDETLARQAVQRGAQGYFLKDDFMNNLVPQMLHCAIQRKVTEQLLFREKARAEVTLNSIGDAVIGTDIFGKIDYLNVAAEEITGWSRHEANGRPSCEIFKIINSLTRKVACNVVELALRHDKTVGLSKNTVLIRKDGREVPIEDSTAPIHDLSGKLTGAVIVFHDVSAALAMSTKLTHLAQHDFLTDLPNRVLLNDRINKAISLAKRNGTCLAILFLDLDHFKHINDSLGHAAGDTLLQSVTRRLNACVRRADTVCRQGGDEFVLLLSENQSKAAAAQTAEKIRLTLALPHTLPKGDVHITTSIGISMYPADGDDVETLIKNADTAMYHAKGNGRNRYEFFKNDMHVHATSP